jgi:A/G-specific adenine glycosylase
LSRVLGWGEDLSQRVHEKALIAAADVVLPKQAADMPAYTQGLMDLGATLCTQRKPSCLMCPWSDLCVARREGEPERYPVKTRKLKRSERESWLAWLVWREQVWLQQMPDKGVWAGLWTLPLLGSEADLLALLGEELASNVEAQPRSKHVLTHLDWYLNPRRVVLPDVSQAAKALEARLVKSGASGQWVALDDLGNWGLPAPLRRLLQG